MSEGTLDIILGGVRAESSDVDLKKQHEDIIKGQHNPALTDLTGRVPVLMPALLPVAAMTVSYGVIPAHPDTSVTLG